jgi:4-oxalocrotonate tautomerase
MPFVRIEVDGSRTTQEVKAISDGVYNALIESVHAPVDDKFHVVTRREAGTLIYSADYLGIARSVHLVAVQIFLYAGRTVDIHT